MRNEAQPDSDLVLYQTEDGRTRIQCRFEDETVWLSLNQLVKNLFEDQELARKAVVAESATTAADGKTYQVEFYNLDVIISVGYRVKSQRGVQFRIWATQRLREFIVKGFTMNDERLKNPPGKGYIDYFDELLERIRDIRSSERRVYLRVREIREEITQKTEGGKTMTLLRRHIERSLVTGTFRSLLRSDAVAPSF